MSNVRGRRDGDRSIRDRPAGAPDGASHADHGPRERHARELPGWLRALFFLPATPRMAHRDLRPAESVLHMAQPFGSQGMPIGRQAEGHALHRRARQSDHHRREIGAVMGLLLVATAFSVAAPVTGLGTEPDPTPIYIIVDEPDEPSSSDGLETADPGGTIALDPTFSAQPTPAPTRQPTPRPTRVRPFAALGDSLTAWPSSNPWPTRLDAQDALLRLVKNAGVPGNTTSQMRARLAKDVYPYKPEVLFVLGGTNDLGYGISESAIIANLRAIIVDAKAKKIMVILINVPPDSYPGMVPKIKSLNAAILHLGNAHRVNVIDIFSVLANKDGTIQSRYTSDGLHFSDLGCQTVANTIRARIRRLGL